METRIETILNAVINGETIEFEPRSKCEEYLKNCVNKSGATGLPEPESRLDALLYRLSEVMVGGDDYTYGYEAGMQAGKQFEYDRFWDSVQENGDRTAYTNGFSGASWNDETYNPKYDIKSGGLNSANNMFQYSQITDTKVRVTLQDTNTQSTFASATLQRIPLVKLLGTVNFVTSFQATTKLSYIRFEGAIQRSINLQWSPLDVDSMKNVISCLAHYSGTADQFKYEVKFNDACWAALEADSAAPNGGTWADYVDSLGWLT